MTPTKQALRDAIAGALDIKKELVHSAAWNIDVEIRGMSGTARAAVMAIGYDGNGKVDYLEFYPALLVASTYVPDTDEPVFEAADRDFINSKSAQAVEELATIAMRLSGLSKDDLKVAEKNSTLTPSSASGTT